MRTNTLNPMKLCSLDLREQPLLPATLINAFLVCLMELFVSSKNIDIPPLITLSIFAVVEVFILYTVYTGSDIFITLSIASLYTIGLHIQFLLIADSKRTDFTDCFEETLLSMMLGLAGAGVLLLSMKLFKRIKKPVVFLFLVAILLITMAIAIVLRLIPDESATYSWISFNGSQFQVTELHKPMFVVYSAFLFSSAINKKWIWSVLYLIASTLSLAACAEFGTALVIIISWIIVNLILLDNKKEAIIVVGGVLVIGFMGFGFLSLINSVTEKLVETSQPIPGWMAFISGQFNKIFGRIQDLSTSDMEQGSQATLAYRAIIRGGWLGSDEIIHIPEERCDYTYAALLLRTGIIFGIIVILLFAIMILRNIYRCESKSETDDTIYNSLALVSGIVIFISALVPICGNIRILPLTGVVLPFIAEGASSGVVNWLMFALILYNTRQQKIGLNEKTTTKTNNIKIQVKR